MKIKNNKDFFSPSGSIPARAIQPEGSNLKMEGVIMQAFTLQKGPVLTPGIRVFVREGQDCIPQWCLSLGKDAPGSIHTFFPVPETAVIKDDDRNKAWGTFRYLNNNAARFLVLIKDQTRQKGVYACSFESCHYPIEAGYCGKGENGIKGGGMEYLVAMVPNDEIHFCIMSTIDEGVEYYSLVATKDELIVRYDEENLVHHMDQTVPATIISGRNGKWPK